MPDQPDSFSSNNYVLTSQFVFSLAGVTVSQELLRTVGAAASSLGYERLTELQKKAILSFVSGNDVFVSLPTGYGKSVCHALLPRVCDILRRVERPS